MQSIYGLIALLIVTPAIAAPGNVQKLQAFKDAKAKLQGDIDLFLKEVDACNPPVAMAKDQIMKGFGDLSKPDSAKSLLNQAELNVSTHAIDSDGKFTSIEKSAAGCGEKSQLSKLASDAAAEVQKNLEEDRSDYKKGTDVANQKKTLVLGILDMRQRAVDSHIPGIGVGDVGQCAAAKKQIDALDADNKDLQAKLGDLQASFADRTVYIQAAINAPNSCGGATLRKASFDDTSPSEDVPAEGTGSIAI